MIANFNTIIKHFLKTRYIYYFRSFMIKELRVFRFSFKYTIIFWGGWGPGARINWAKIKNITFFFFVGTWAPFLKRLLIVFVVVVFVFEKIVNFIVL
jgi:hypothetical protein